VRPPSVRPLPVSPLDPAFTPIVLEQDPDVIVAQVRLRLTVYLDDAPSWARGAAAEALRAFLAVAPVEKLQWWTTSLMQDWHRVSGHGMDTLLRALSNEALARPRHQFQFRLADTISAPGVGFYYREVDGTRVPRAGVLELTLPPEQDPADLLQLAVALGQGFPVHCAVGGYAVAWSLYQQATAFWWAYRFCRRYLGLDVQDAERMAGPARTALPGTNWLTLLGPGILAAHDADAAALRDAVFRDPDSRVMTLARAVLVQAGAGPVLGDVNQLDLPRAYIEVAQRLEEYLVEPPPEYWGGFGAEAATRPWLRRFLEPEHWSA
jgi:hypothetical protein